MSSLWILRFHTNAICVAIYFLDVRNWRGRHGVLLSQSLLNGLKYLVFTVDGLAPKLARHLAKLGLSLV